MQVEETVVETAVENQETVVAENTNVTAFPAELEFNATRQSWSDEKRAEEAAKYYEANPDKKPQAKTEEKPAKTIVNEGAAVVEGEEKPKEEKPVDANFDAAVYEDEDVKSLDDVKAALKERKQLKADQEKIELAFAEFQKDKELLSKAKNPVHPKIQKVNNFMHATGIDSFDVARRVVELTPEEAKKSPLHAMTAAAILDNPDLALIDGGYDAVYRQICRKNGVTAGENFDELDQETKETIAFEATNAYKTLNEKSKTFETGPDDFFNSLTKETTAQIEQQKNNLEAWKPQTEKLASALKKTGIAFSFKTEKYGELNLSVAVSEDEVNKVLDSFKGYQSSKAPDEKVVQQFSDVVSRTLMTPDKIQSVVESAISHYEKTKLAEVKKETIRTNHNGGPETVDKSKAAPAKDGYSEFNNRVGKKQ